MPHTEQHTAVQDHFRGISVEWGRRYEHPPERMSDLDLQLRRQTARRILVGVARAHPGTLALLDVGCGAGSLLESLPDGAFQVYGVDLVPEMVAEAARRNPGGTFLVSDAAELPFGPASMDVITCLGVLEYVPDPESALRDIVRALRPGGHLIVSFPNRRSLFRTLSRWEIALESALARCLRPGRRRAAAGAEARKYRHAHWSLGEVEQMCARCGLRVQAVFFQTFGLWGRVGRFRAALALSESLSRRWGHSRAAGSALASTLVLHARRSGASESSA